VIGQEAALQSYVLFHRLPAGSRRTAGAQRLKALEAENTKLKKLLADA